MHFEIVPEISGNAPRHIYVQPSPLPTFPVTRITGDGLVDDSLNSPLLFYHIPQTAGTTLTDLLDQIFGASHWKAQSDHILRGNEAGFGNYKLISGHISREFAWAHFPKADMLTVLRDPVDRAVSQWANWADHSRVQWNSEAWVLTEADAEALERAACTGPMEFLQSTDNQSILENSRNVFTRALCDDPPTDPLTTDRALVESAFENLRRFFWIGLVSDMTASLLLLGRQLNIATSRFTAALPHNVTEGRKQLSRSERDELRRINSLDYELMELARPEFERRMKLATDDAMIRATHDAALARSIIREQRYRHDFGDILFIDGWSYEEADGEGRPFRWALGGQTVALALRPPADLGPEAILIEFDVRGTENGCEIDHFACLLEKRTARRSWHQRTDAGDRFCFLFDQPAIRRDWLRLELTDVRREKKPVRLDRLSRLAFACTGITLTSFAR